MNTSAEKETTAQYRKAWLELGESLYSIGGGWREKRLVALAQQMCKILRLVAFQIAAVYSKIRRHSKLQQFTVKYRDIPNSIGL